MNKVQGNSLKTSKALNLVVELTAILVVVLVVNFIGAIRQTTNAKNLVDKPIIVESTPDYTPVEDAQIEQTKTYEPIPAPQPKKIVAKKKTTTQKASPDKETINKYVREICAKYKLEPELIMSMITQESGYRPTAQNGNCLGLMQVSSRWHAKRAAKLGVTNFYDPYGNILLGVDYVSELLQKYKDPSFVLMIYNMGPAGASKMYKQGKISNYAKTILARAEQYKKGE